MLSSARSTRPRLLGGEGDLIDQGLLVGVRHGGVKERSCMRIPTGLRCGALLGFQGEEW